MARAKPPKPTVYDLTHHDAFRRLETFEHPKIFAATVAEFKRGTWIAAAAILLMLANFVALIAFSWRHPGAPWMVGAQVAGGIVLGTIVPGLVTMAVERWAIKSLGAKNIEVQISEDGIVNQTAEDFVFDRGEFVTVLLLDLSPLLLWLALAWFVPGLRPLLLALALMQQITVVSAVTFLSAIWRYRRETLYAFDRDHATHLYARVPDGYERVLRPATLGV